MNKQELIKEVKEIGIYGLNIFGTVVEGIPTKTTIKLIKQLDEPQKPVVPQFVADWYEENKDEFELNLWVFLTDFDEENIDMSERFGIWLGDEDNNPIQTLVNMHQFGYEVEKEPKYIVKIKGILKANEVLNYKINEGKWVISSGVESAFFRTKHTHKQLEDGGFGEVFNSPLFEVEEVTE